MTAPAEAATILRRLAHKRGCGSVALVGLVLPEMVASLSTLTLLGFDDPERTSYAATLWPAGRWGRLADAPRWIVEADSPVVGLSFAALATLDDSAFADILDAAAGVLVCEADPGPGDVLERFSARRAELVQRGATIVAEDLIVPLHTTSQRRTAAAFVITGADSDGSVAALTQAGLRGLRLDPAVNSWTEPQRPARVMIASYEVVGPSRNGGIGTANTSLALALAERGHEVTLLFTGRPGGDSTVEHWVERFGERGVEYHELDRERADRVVINPFINVRLAWATYERIRELHEERPFDVIHAPECQGHLAFVALAKRHGLAFDDAELVTGVHSTTRWCAEANRMPLHRIDGFADEFLEQISVRESDVVISPSAYLLGYLHTRGWALPARSFVQQYVTSQETKALQEIDADGEELESSPHDRAALELVFFGRLERRKGLAAFCDALDRLADEVAADALHVTFMGSSTTTIENRDATEYIGDRTRNWPWQICVEPGLSHAEAIERLRGRHLVAVMPSLVDNSPNTVYEALALGIPLIVSRSGGTGELIALDDLGRVSFPGWPEDGPLDPPAANESPPSFNVAPLAELLRTAVATMPTPARMRVDPEVNEHVHAAWTAGIAARSRSEPVDDPPAPSIERLSPADSSPEAHDEAARAATGELLVVLPQDVFIEPALDDVLGRAAARSNADVFLLVATSDGGDVLVPAGGPPLLALSHPIYGTNGFAIRAEALRGLGGFRAIGADGSAASDLLVRAGLAGLRIEVLPAVLVRAAHPPDLTAIGGAVHNPNALTWGDSPDALLAAERHFRTDGPLADLSSMYLSAEVALGHHLRDWPRVHGELLAHAERVQAHADNVQAHAEELQRRLQVVYESRSWRLTAALRRPVQAIRERR